MSGPFYFGTLDRIPGRSGDGHFLYGQGLASVHRHDRSLLPLLLRPEALDTGYAPLGGQVQSLATLTHIHGWTVLAMWDRSGDTRPGSNSAFLIEGTCKWADACDLAEAHFPEVWERITKAAPVTFAGGAQ